VTRIFLRRATGRAVVLKLAFGALHLAAKGGVERLPLHP